MRVNLLEKKQSNMEFQNMIALKGKNKPQSNSDAFSKLLEEKIKAKRQT